MKHDDVREEWLDSKRAREELRLSSCDLSHIRGAGKLRYQKKGNAYLYLKKDIDNVKKAGGHRG